MSTLPPDDLLGRWKREELSPEQAIGQLLQYLVQLVKRIEVLELALLKANRQIAELKQDRT